MNTIIKQLSFIVQLVVKQLAMWKIFILII